MKVKQGFSEFEFTCLYGTDIHFCDCLCVNKCDSDTYNPKLFCNLPKQNLNSVFSSNINLAPKKAWEYNNVLVPTCRIIKTWIIFQLYSKSLSLESKFDYYILIRIILRWIKNLITFSINRNLIIGYGSLTLEKNRDTFYHTWNLSFLNHWHLNQNLIATYLSESFLGESKFEYHLNHLNQNLIISFGSLILKKTVDTFHHTQNLIFLNHCHLNLSLITTY